MFNTITRDLAHAFRSLRKERGFTLVCVISLGIGMGALVGLATFTRAVWAPARVINTEGLTELNKSYDIDKEDAKDVASTWLEDNDLAG